uniref:Uncharacterized protein n=1 Tax=Salmonella phage vB_SEnST11_KE04 TaxID=3161162 RepID=A0AAU8GFG8_9CAUD
MGYRWSVKQLKSQNLSNKRPLDGALILSVIIPVIPSQRKLRNTLFKK